MRRSAVLGCCLLAAVAMCVDTALGQNLLLNPSFEVPEDGGNSQIWFGDYTTFSVPNGAGSRVFPPHPPHLDGEWGYEISLGDPGSPINSRFYQPVAVGAGETATFAGSFHVFVWSPGSNPGTTAQAVAKLWDGMPDVGSLIDEVTVTPDTPPTNEDWVEATLTGAASSGEVTVEILISIDVGAWGDVSVVHLDAFSLTSSVACAVPHTLTSISSNTGPHNADIPGVILTGSGFDADTVVKMVQVPAEDIRVATLTGQTATSLTVTLPTNGAAVGLYNILVEKPDCTGQVLVDGFEVVCADPTSFLSVDPSQLHLPQSSPVQLTISGINLNRLDTVSLVSSISDIQGTIDGMVGDDMLATFNLTNEGAGGYNLEGTRSDGCMNPEPLVNAFVLLQPGGDNLLFNGDFEAEGPKSPDEQPVGGWTNDLGGPAPKYDGSTHVPSTGLDGGVNDTDNRGSVDQGGSAPMQARVFQTVDVVPSRTLSLSGYITGATTDIVHSHRVILRDGDMNGAELASFQHDSGFGWTPFTIEGVPTQTTVVVEWGFGGDLPGGYGIVATHVDELVLVEVGVPCNAPFADADDDGDVDQDDFAVWQLCHTGAGTGVSIPVNPEYCGCFDQEGPLGGPDGDIDQADFQKFEACSSGPMVPADPACND